jgi:cytochrome oxidase assembly protein ShyY1
MAVLSVLRQRRYATLGALMLLIATLCVLLGVWQLARLSEKHDTNITLRRNAHVAPVPVGTLLRPADDGPPPGRTQVQFRQATAGGTFDGNHQSLLRNQTINGATGYLVITPLRTAEATLLVVRGFITGPSATVSAPPPPSGPVSVTINATEQAARLDGPVLDGYGILLPGQTGTARLVAVPPPDLSNPAGGVPEIQHLAYVIQWFLFAGLALAAPVVMARAEAGRPTGELGEEETPTPQEARAAKLADRYGRARR